MLDLWYKSAIIYCLDVENFIDGNGDGVGDFEGLTQRLDYLSGLGITCIWLMPFYPTPNLDKGYDIKDYYNVDPRHGTLGDFVEFMRQASDRGLRVIIDLVVNHTSIEHPWFQKARQDKHSKYRDFYVWSQEKPPDAEEGIVFPGVQTTTWTYDDHRLGHSGLTSLKDWVDTSPLVGDFNCDPIRPSIYPSLNKGTKVRLRLCPGLTETVSEISQIDGKHSVRYIL